MGAFVSSNITIPQCARKEYSKVFVPALEDQLRGRDTKVGPGAYEADREMYTKSKTKVNSFGKQKRMHHSAMGIEQTGDQVFIVPVDK